MLIEWFRSSNPILIWQLASMYRLISGDSSVRALPLLVISGGGIGEQRRQTGLHEVCWVLYPLQRLPAVSVSTTGSSPGYEASARQSAPQHLCWPGSCWTPCVPKNVGNWADALKEVRDGGMLQEERDGSWSRARQVAYKLLSQSLTLDVRMWSKLSRAS